MKDNKYESGFGTLLILGLIVFGIYAFTHHSHKSGWSASYETTTSNEVWPGPAFDSEAACLDYIHEGHPPSTYGWECGSNCKRMSSDTTAPFECDETAQ